MLNMMCSTWDKLVWNGGSCFVSGTLTDDKCTAGEYISVPYYI